ncbi:putative ABC transport system permease protein [Pontibacter ummariensis]|uniref:Putative ABC transport system permease protein n=1 Tax=Pontibacter ummariensis TaxID=1610492 RepID=A0A239D9C7_9BACT|nr:ABC transporter permease [Pontibacter ummariensis]PRY14286.1 putative ABC transport system permease protein [Pontibacter ummariensis]SNS28223.1 putative ABC transport system permease protein [Pontibacter ummariensis]
MLRNYFKIAFRNLLRNKVYSTINIVGLAIGVASCILIFLYVKDELSYENHFSKADRIVRVAGEVIFEGHQDAFSVTPPPLYDAVREFSGVESVTQFFQAGKQTVWYQDQSFTEDKLLFADSAFFRVFDYAFVAGNPATALSTPNAIVLTEELAQKYFGGAAQAMGQVLRFSKDSYTVTGVYRDQGHSHIAASGLLSRLTVDSQTPEDVRNNQWFNLNRYTYALLPDPQHIPDFQKQLDVLTEAHVNPWIKENRLSAHVKYIAQPLKSIHFDTRYGGDGLSPKGNISYVYIFGAVAVFLLLIACINYMNLATARSAKRAKEVGLRKVVGADRSQIIWQFIGESVLLTLIAVLLALALVQIFIPNFNTLTDKNFTSDFFMHWEFLSVVLAIVLFVGIVAGSYPAFFLSGFKPADVLKSDKHPKGGSATLRRALVVLQFSISLIMIIGTIVVFMQMHFLKNSDLGFKKEQVMVIDIPSGDSTLVQHLPLIKQKLEQHPKVLQTSNTLSIPAEGLSRTLMLMEQDGEMVEKTMDAIAVDHDFIPVLGIQMQAGRNFSPNIKTDERSGIIINEAAAKWLGWADPLGKKVITGNEEIADNSARVIGVVKDFHITSLHSEVQPLAIFLVPQSAGYLLARLAPEDQAATIQFIQEQWRTFDPEHPMEYFFMDEFFDKQYRAEEKMLTVFGYFAGLTILIACLGLFGLASFTAEQRTKEIGIRKVLGSSVSDIVLLLSKDFALLVLLAIALASPIAWYGMRQWLQDFAYRVDLSWWIFAIAGFAALAIALLTVSLQAVKAALLDPVKALRT